MPFDKRRKKGKIRRTQEKGEGKKITQDGTDSCIYTFLCNTYISCAIPKKRDNCTGIALRQYICVALRSRHFPFVGRKSNETFRFVFF